MARRGVVAKRKSAGENRRHESVKSWRRRRGGGGSKRKENKMALAHHGENSAAKHIGMVAKSMWLSKYGISVMAISSMYIFCQ